MSLKELYKTFTSKSKNKKTFNPNQQNFNKLQPPTPWPNPPVRAMSGKTSSSNFFSITGAVIPISTGNFGAISGFHTNLLDFDDFLKEDKRPDFEKSYDVFLKRNKDSDKKLTEKEMFEEAMKIGWSIGRLNNNN